VEACAAGDHGALLRGVGYATLGSAVLESQPGDEVVACPGVHLGIDIVILHDLVLRAADPTEGATILELGLEMTDPADLTVFGVTLRDVGQSPAAIHLKYAGGGGSITAEHCRFEGEQTGIFAMGDIAIDVRHSRFEGGQALYSGSHSPVEVSLLDTVMTAVHGGLQIDGPSNVTLTDVVLLQTEACGAIVVTHQANSDPVSIVASNTSFWSGRPGPSPFYPVPAAVSLQEGDSFECTGCDWFDNLPHDVVVGDEPYDRPGSETSF
ncbi:MAG: hypothetical protein ABMA64_06695, partial [Myxococcota bacterium]